ncbi:U1 zinc finger protein [Cardiosporidium cionae]|uniref:U1 small nuclear ribonucleoprotein C n=1 Tax=Cardiosporidium cionae TaxID=476202 RepID=A0ABQ7J741_9APIC|nr:U1 zinc finger protein [Cardiosporidium cionae]|eukprot:KAF8819803.1 U1 zinc finger protein [Cardiosporidium cionae]
MPKFYCEYCDIYLTHSSPAGRRQHTSGRKHISAKVEYYQNLIREQGFQAPVFPGRGPPRPPGEGFPLRGNPMPGVNPAAIRPMMIRGPYGPNGGMPMRPSFPNMPPMIPPSGGPRPHFYRPAPPPPI